MTPTKLDLDEAERLVRWVKDNVPIRLGINDAPQLAIQLAAKFENAVARIRELEEFLAAARKRVAEIELARQALEAQAKEDEAAMRKCSKLHAAGQCCSASALLEKRLAARKREGGEKWLTRG